MKYIRTLNNLSSRELMLLVFLCVELDGQKTKTFELTEVKRRMRTSFSSYLDLYQVLRSLILKTKSIPLFLFYKLNMTKKVLFLEVNSDVVDKTIGHFNKKELRAFSSLRSKYSKLLFLLFKKYKSSGICYVSMDEFRSFLNVPTTYKTRTVTERIVNSTIKELPPLFKNLHVEKIRESRQIVALKFTFSFFEIKRKPFTQKIICPYCEHKFSYITFPQEKTGVMVNDSKSIQNLTFKIMDIANKNPNIIEIKKIDFNEGIILLINKARMSVGEYPINEETLTDITTFIKKINNLWLPSVTNT